MSKKLHAVLNVSGFADMLAKLVKLTTPGQQDEATRFISITADDSGLTFIASNQSLTVAHRAPKTDLGEGSDILEDGSVLVHGRTFNDALKKFPPMVDLQEKGNQFVIASGKSKFQMAVRPETSKSWLVQTKAPLDMTIDAAKFKEAVKTVIYAVATVDTRPILTGVHFKGDGNGDTIVEATDGLRLAYTKLPGFEFPECIIPEKALSNVLSVIPDEGEVKLGMQGNSAAIEFGTTRLNLRLLDGGYPDTSKLLNVNAKVNMTINTDTLSKAVQRCRLVKADNNLVVFQLSKDNQLLTMDTQSRDGVSNHEELAVESVDGDIVIGLNAKYLEGALKCAHVDKTAKLIFNTDDTPAMMVIPGSPELHLISPVRITR